MKTHRFIKYLCALTLFIGLATAFTSCDDWNDDTGWDTFNDKRLAGDWQLTQSNGEPVGNNETNYLSLNGQGEGTYYYLSNGMVMNEPVSYNCQASVSGNTYYQMNIKYGLSMPITVNYYFRPDMDSFVMQWWDSDYGRKMTYVYTRVNEIPW